MRFLKTILALVQKDIALELRTKEMLNSMIVFVLLTLVIFNFAFGEALEKSGEFLGGILWVSFLFAAVLGLNRVFVHEKDEACLDGLMLVPAERSFIYFGKAIATFLFLSVVEIVALPIFSILFGINFLPHLFLLLLVLLLSNIGIAAVGTLLSAISINTKARDLMLPILFFPVIVPILVGAVNSTRLILSASEFVADIYIWLRIIAIYDIIFILIGFLTFEYVIEE